MDIKLLHVEFGRAKLIKKALRYSVIVKFRAEDNSIKKVLLKLILLGLMYS